MCLDRKRLQNICVKAEGGVTDRCNSYGYYPGKQRFLEERGKKKLRDISILKGSSRKQHQRMIFVVQLSEERYAFDGNLITQ